MKTMGKTLIWRSEKALSQKRWLKLPFLWY